MNKFDKLPVFQQLNFNSFGSGGPLAKNFFVLFPFISPGILKHFFYFYFFS